MNLDIRKHNKTKYLKQKPKTNKHKMAGSVREA